MTGRILLLGPETATTRSLMATLRAEYFIVCRAEAGEALSRVVADSPDVAVLTDLGDEEQEDDQGARAASLCRALKRHPASALIPLMALMVPGSATATLGQTLLEAGADDVLVSPIGPTALCARLRALARMKMLTDELRCREQAHLLLGGGVSALEALRSDEKPPAILLAIPPLLAPTFVTMLTTLGRTHSVATADVGLMTIGPEWDFVVCGLEGADQSVETRATLSAIGALRAQRATRFLPILTLSKDAQSASLLKAFELGATDSCAPSAPLAELRARVRTMVHRRRLTERLRQKVDESLAMAVTDQVTGLHNRHYLEHRLNIWAGDPRRNGRALAAAVIDIDHFKRVNDSHGHNAGDEVLREVATRVRASVRGVDLCVRYGGEEFLVLMPDADLEGAAAIAERLRQVIAHEPFRISGEREGIVLTVSIGIAAAQGVDPRALLLRADAALYTAKRQGRNQVVQHAA